MRRPSRLCPFLFPLLFLVVLPAAAAQPDGKMPYAFRDPAQAGGWLFPLAQDSGRVALSVDSTLRATVSLADSSGRTLGAWVRDGCWEGNRAWECRGGALRVDSLSLDSTFTVEVWFRLEPPQRPLPLPLYSHSPHPDTPLIQLAADSSATGCRMVLSAVPLPGGGFGLELRAGEGLRACSAGLLSTGVWSHLAWVRRGDHHTVYLNRRSVLELHRPGSDTARQGRGRLTLGWDSADTPPPDSLLLPLRFDCLRLSGFPLSEDIFLNPPQDSTSASLPRVLCFLSYRINPFSPSSTRRFLVPAGLDRPPELRVEVRNWLGRPVRTLVRDSLPPGTHQCFWDGRDEASDRLPGGMYYYYLTDGVAECVSRLLMPY